MYIFKNAIRNVFRSKGRSILIGIILCILMFSACIGLSIQQASIQSQKAAESLTNITGQIEVNRMNQTKPEENGNNTKQITLKQLKKYAKSKYVENFTYFASLSLQASDSFSLLENQQSMPQGPEQNSSIQLIGYENDEAMTNFSDGTSTISKGKMFDENTTENQCILPEELATYNSISVGDTITLKVNDSTTVDFIVTGFYTTTNNSFMNSNNTIYTSYEVVKNISTTNNLDLNIQGTYTFKTVKDFKKFKKECQQKGLSNDYTITSQDLHRYEQSVTPLQNLSKFSRTFLIIICVIGAIVLILINLFNIRERKQEIGILCALGMHKSKIILQFVLETLCISLFALVIGAGLGAISSVPLTNTLLESQITSQNKMVEQKEANFDRGQESMDHTEAPKDNPSLSKATTISEATNMKVLFEVCALSIIFILISNGVGLFTILRYDPSEILAKQD